MFGPEYTAGRPACSAIADGFNGFVVHLANHVRTSELNSSAEAGNQRPLAEWAATTGTDWATYTQEAPGMSAFALDDDVIYHTYSTNARGLDGLWGMYQWLDRAPQGRNEARTPDAPLNWFRRHDEYDSE